MVQLPDRAESLSLRTEAFLHEHAELYEIAAALDIDGDRERHQRLAGQYPRLIALLAPPVKRRLRR